MKPTTSFYKFGLFLCSFFALCSVTYGLTYITFKLDDATQYVNTGKISRIHFSIGGNDFGGLVAWKETTLNETGIVKTENGQQVDCKNKISGLYYNSQRGERLWPLDKITSDDLGFTSDGLLMSGGLFTSCSGAVAGLTGDAYGIYGRLSHTFNTQNYILLAGMQYSTKTNTVKPTSSLASTFQRFDNKYPVGLVYDYNGGIGFLGCTIADSGLTDKLNDFIEIANTSGVANLFMLSGAGVRPATGYDKLLDCSKAIVTLDQLLLLKIQGIIGMSSDVKDDTKNLAGNEADSKTQYFSSVSVNNATLINAAKRRAEELCRGKRGSSSNDVICQEGATTKTVSEIAGKTLIVKKGNLILKGVSSLATQPLDIFVDEGVLTFNPESSRISFDTKGHPVSSYAMGVASGVYLKGNFVINGLVKVTQDYKYFIHGKFTSLNTYAAPSSQRMTQLDNLLEPNPTADEIDLTKVFKWRCNYGSGSDGIACPPSEFQGAPLIIINQNYPSRLLQ